MLANSNIGVAVDRPTGYRRRYSLQLASVLGALGLVLLAAWLRLWNLASIPPGLWFDESLNGMEVIWMLKTGTWPIFILQGQGREPMFYYLLALSISMLGLTTYAIRLVPALLGILTISLMYRWTVTLFKGEAEAGWIALISTAGLAVSFWYLIMNRIGYRANTLLPVLLLTSYFFWRGWQSGRLKFYLLAGLGLGLCQYTYLAGRLVPLVFIVFAVALALLRLAGDAPGGRRVWLGLLLMSGTALLVVLPLLLFFARYPELAWERGGDVIFTLSESGGVSALIAHLISAGRVFIDGQDPNWRHHLVGRPVFDWLCIAGFWLGLPAVVRRYRRPVNLFLLITLGVMWLPALLSEPTFHTLRLVGILPAYYVIVALGLLNAARWIGSRFQAVVTIGQTAPAALAALLLFSGGTTIYDYFYRWARLPQVYQAYDGPVVDLAAYLASPQSGTSLVIPYYLYAHSSIRYLLYEHFQEEVLLPPEVMTRLKQQEYVNLVVPEYPPDDHLPPAWVWLVKEETGPGTAYVSSVRRDISLARLASPPAQQVKGSRNNLIAQQYQVDPTDILPLFPRQLPRKTAAVAWADNLLLTGYEFAPASVEAGRTGQLYLSWKMLGYIGLEEKMFLQLLNSRGQPVGQAEIDPISRKMYRWRDDQLVLEQHPLRLDASLPAGLYFVRLGFFNPRTGQRLPAYNPARQPLGDELLVGPLYVQAHGVDPLRPQQEVRAMLGQKFELLGYSIYPGQDSQAVEIELYWQLHAPAELDYTVFIQLLDPQNRIIAQVDTQPLAGLYPTSRWQAGDIISDRFFLAVAAPDLAADNRLVTGMYDLATGTRLPAYDQDDKPLPDGLIELK